jgi:subtilisin family serine protease
MDEVGIAIAGFATREDAEAMLAYGFDVMPDVEINWLPGEDFQATGEHIGLDETFYGFQWHLPAIKADLAWDEGYTGAGARVAIVDSGIWYLHPDLAGNIDFAASATFVPGTVDFMDDDGHGTHVAGIVAAADNDWGSIGVAPNATLIAVKVLDSTGSGAWSWIIDGIIHAANQDVDVINLSLGNFLKKSGEPPYYTSADASFLINVIRKALHYAKSQGCLVISSAGNDAVDLDHIGNWIKIPAEAGNGVIVSATGPYGFAFGATDFSRIASYTNYGKSAITVAAPGGDFMYPGDLWWWDMVFSTTINGWSWMAGTSMATPVVSGVAALIVSKYGSMQPPQLEHKIVKAADDLGKKGKDKYYGKGFVNAYEAVK